MRKGSLYNGKKISSRVKLEAVAFVFQKGKLRGFYQVENMSETGIALGGRAPLRIGEAIDLMIQLSGRPGIRLMAEVVHCSEKPIESVYIIGMKFTEVDQKTRAAIAHAVKPNLKHKDSAQQGSLDGNILKKCLMPS